MKSTQDRAKGAVEELKGTTLEQFGSKTKRPAPPEPVDKTTSRFQKKTGQIRRDFGR